MMVADGSYTGIGNCNLDFDGKTITIKSLNGPLRCIIDGEPSGHEKGFYFHNGEDENSVIEGFTFTHFLHAIDIGDSSPTIKNCIFFDNGWQNDDESSAINLNLVTT